MSRLKKLLLTILGIIAFGILAWRLLMPALFVSAGRGPVNDDTLSVTRVFETRQTLNAEGVSVEAGPGHKFVSLDCHIKAPVSKVDLYDFQLVKAKVVELGTEENLGNNLDRDYAFRVPLGPDGLPVEVIPEDATEFNVRMTFKVPDTAQEGYLFYWGIYYGPFRFLSEEGG